MAITRCIKSCAVGARRKGGGFGMPANSANWPIEKKKFIDHFVDLAI